MLFSLLPLVSGFQHQGCQLDPMIWGSSFIPVGGKVSTTLSYGFKECKCLPSGELSCSFGSKCPSFKPMVGTFCQYNDQICQFGESVQFGMASYKTQMKCMNNQWQLMNNDSWFGKMARAITDAVKGTSTMDIKDEVVPTTMDIKDKKVDAIVPVKDLMNELDEMNSEVQLLKKAKKDARQVAASPTLVAPGDKKELHEMIAQIDKQLEEYSALAKQKLKLVGSTDLDPAEKAKLTAKIKEIDAALSGVGNDITAVNNQIMKLKAEKDKLKATMDPADKLLSSQLDRLNDMLISIEARLDALEAIKKGSATPGVGGKVTPIAPIKPVNPSLTPKAITDEAMKLLAEKKKLEMEEAIKDHASQTKLMVDTIDGRLKELSKLTDMKVKEMESLSAKMSPEEKEQLLKQLQMINYGGLMMIDAELMKAAKNINELSLADIQKQMADLMATKKITRAVVDEIMMKPVTDDKLVENEIVEDLNVLDDMVSIINKRLMELSKLAKEKLASKDEKVDDATKQKLMEIMEEFNSEMINVSVALVSKMDGITVMEAQKKIKMIAMKVLQDKNVVDKSLLDMKSEMETLLGSQKLSRAVEDELMQKPISSDPMFENMIIDNLSNLDKIAAVINKKLIELSKMAKEKLKGKDVDPETKQQIGMLLKEIDDQADLINVALVSKIEGISVMEAQEALRQLALKVFESPELWKSPIEFDEKELMSDMSIKEKISRSHGQPEVRSPNPGSNTGCRDAFDCHGESVYCHQGNPKNYCTKSNGVGSICRNNEGCGWLGHGSSARKMYCSYGYCVDPYNPHY